MKQPWMMTSSDGDLVPMGEGVPHPRSYGTYPRKIREYVVERGVVDLAAAVRSMTSLPATVFRVSGHGVLREGAFADVVVFDLARVDDPATFSDPHRPPFASRRARASAEGCWHDLDIHRTDAKYNLPLMIRGAARATEFPAREVPRQDIVGSFPPHAPPIHKERTCGFDPLKGSPGPSRSRASSAYRRWPRRSRRTSAPSAGA
jgi:hypothetical protein